MGRYLKQAQHNESFHSAINTHFASSFFDWKITCLFYAAIHYLKELGDFNGLDIGHSHTDIEVNVSPHKGATLMPIPDTEWTMYRNLYRYSRSARYTGFATDEKTFEACRALDYKYSLADFTAFKQFVTQQTSPPMLPQP